MALLLKTDGPPVFVVPENGTDFSLSELQGFVGGYIKIRPLLGIHSGSILVLNEEGKLRGLPFNRTATFLYQVSYGVNDFIVGDVLLCESNQVL